MDELDGTDKTIASGGDLLDRSGTQIGSGVDKTDFQKGSIFAGRYEILSEGLRGGMGVVYKCRDTTLQRLKALKIMHPHLLKSTQAVQRFHQEVAISQDLQHDHIVCVYDLGGYEGQEFFTMEWAGEKNLRELIEERKLKRWPFSLDEAYRIISQVCEALQYAHDYTIHRDIKPENILIVSDKDDIKIKLTDFGIAKMLTTSQFTTTSKQMGTPYYMAPEQKLDAGHVDKRADIYSVGVVLFELLTLENTTGLEMPTEINRELPAEIDGVIKRTLVRRPEDRYGEAVEVGMALLQVVKLEKKRKERALEEEVEKVKREAELEKQLKEKKKAERKKQKKAERKKQKKSEKRQFEAEVKTKLKAFEKKVGMVKVAKQQQREASRKIKRFISQSALPTIGQIAGWISKYLRRP